MNSYRVYLVFFSLLLIVSCNRAEKEYNKEIIKADSLYSNQEYKKAKLSYNKADLLNPTNTYAKQKLAKIDSIFALNLKKIKFQEAIKQADDLFAKQEYEKALDAYQYTLTMRNDNTYANSRIEELNLLMQTAQNYSDKPYHIIVGCFAQKQNAIRLQKKLIAANFDSKLIPRQNASLTAVSYSSFATIHEAYNQLKKAKISQNIDSWVLYYNFVAN